MTPATNNREAFPCDLFALRAVEVAISGDKLLSPCCAITMADNRATHKLLQSRQLDDKYPVTPRPGDFHVTTVGIFEAKNRLSELVERAARGEEIVITRRGEEVARLMPPRAPDALGQARTLAARIRHSRVGHPLGGGGSLRDMIEEGRR